MSQESEASQAHRFHPGETAPQPGAYSCDGEGPDCPHRFTSEVQGEPFPGLPAGCTGGGWVRQAVA